VPQGSALVPLVIGLAILATDVWVYTDARARAEQGSPVELASGSVRIDTPAAWFVGCLLLWVLFFPLYVTSRNRAG
jgi:hypothetical protein